MFVPAGGRSSPKRERRKLSSMQISVSVCRLRPSLLHRALFPGVLVLIQMPDAVDGNSAVKGFLSNVGKTLIETEKEELCGR